MSKTHYNNKKKWKKWCRDNLNGCTASKTEVHKEFNSRRWLWPPSLPLTEPGRALFSITTGDQKIEHDDLVNKSSSSCQSWHSQYQVVIWRWWRDKARRKFHTRTNNNTMTNLSKNFNSFIKQGLSSFPGKSRSRVFLLETWEQEVFSSSTRNSSTKLETRMRNFTSTHSTWFFLLKISPP